MNETLFYVFGIALVVSAAALALVGLRIENFPPTRAALGGVIGYFVALVAATTTFAVLNAADEQSQREGEEAAAAAAQPAPSGATTTTGSTNPATTPGVTPGSGSASAGGGGGAGEQAVGLGAESSAIAFDTTKLSAKAGKVTIDFDNPSPLTHDVCLEGPGQTDLGCSDTISES